MVTYSTSQAAKKLGIGLKTLSRYIEQGKVPRPLILTVGTATLHAWTAGEIEKVRRMLPKIANGRKTRYQKKQSAVRTRGTPGQAQQSAKTKRRKKPKN